MKPVGNSQPSDGNGAPIDSPVPPKLGEDPLNGSVRDLSAETVRGWIEYDEAEMLALSSELNPAGKEPGAR